MTPYSREEIAQLLENLGRIRDAKVRAAFLYLVTEAKTRAGYEAKPGKHGRILDFRYYRDEKWLYAFIPNQNSLLWYFRRPLLSEQTVDLSALRDVFDEVAVTNGEEITVRLNSLEDAERILSFLI